MQLQVQRHKRARRRRDDPAIERRSVLVLTAISAVAMAAAAASCGGESESTSVTAAVGAAFPSLERITETGVFDSAASKVVGTSCPAGKKLVGAGGRIRAESGPPSWIGTLQSGQVGLTRITPSDTLTSVIVTGAELTSNHPFNWAVQSYGTCEAETAAHELEYIRVGSATTSDKARGVGAECPSGKRVVGAGGSVGALESDVGKIALIGIATVGHLETVYAQATEIGAGTANNWRLFAYAVCAAEASVPGLELRRGETAFDSSHDKYASADCSAGKKVVGAAGFINWSENGFFGTVALTGLVIHGGPVARVSVFAAETGNGTTASWAIHAHAICATP
jgi:hypothetical protein